MIVVAMITAMTFSASGAAPTPLYHLYQEQFALTPALITVIFAAYALSLLLALLTTGALSDHVGRRPTWRSRRWSQSESRAREPVRLPGPDDRRVVSHPRVAGLRSVGRGRPQEPRR
jgi:hypothetical protein